MLLLFKPAVGITQANLGLTIGLSGVTGITATLGTTMGVTPPTSVELMVFDVQSINFGLVGISAGFVTRNASLGLNMGLAPMGGYSDSPTLTIQYGLTGTMGSFFDGIGSLGITFGVSGGTTPVGAGTIGVLLGLAGVPDISGGTVSSGASAGVNFGITGSAGMVSAASIDLRYDISGTGESDAAIVPSPEISHITFSASPDHITFST